MVSTEWIATTATGTKVHLMSAKQATGYKSGALRIERLRPRCGQRTGRAYITPRFPVVDADLSSLPMCDKCVTSSEVE